LAAAVEICSECGVRDDGGGMGWADPFSLLLLPHGNTAHFGPNTAVIPPIPLPCHCLSQAVQLVLATSIQASSSSSSFQSIQYNKQMHGQMAAAT